MASALRCKLDARVLAILLGTVAALAVIPVEAGAGTQECYGSPATIVRGNGDNTINGTPGPDVIVAGGGDDVVRAGGRSDRVCGGNGRDRLFGDEGRDFLIGGTGGDVLRDLSGDNDSLVGDRASLGPIANARGGGNDTLVAREGMLVGDSFTGGGNARGGGDDLLKGAGYLFGDSWSYVGMAAGGGDDRLQGEGARDRLIGDSFSGNFALGGGNDLLDGGGGPDVLTGDSRTEVGTAMGSGKDTLIGGADDDRLFGDNWVIEGGTTSGGDRDNLRAGRGNDDMDGGPRRDRCTGARGHDTATRCEVTTGVP